MNTRAVPFFIAILAYLPAITEEIPEKQSRRKKAQKERKAYQERLAKAPKKRFDMGDGPGKVHFTFQHMTFAELEEAKQVLIAEKSYDTAIEYAKQQGAIATDTEASLLPGILLEMSDLLYAKQDYDKAWRAYAQWAVQFPGAHEKISSELQKMQPELSAELTSMLTLVRGSAVLSESELFRCSQTEHAAFRAVDAAFRCTQDPDRDQTQTHLAIELADRFLQHKDQFKTHRATVELIRSACYEKLITSELSICAFYRSQGDHATVKARLELIEKDYGTKFPDAKKHVVAYRAQHYGETTAEPLDAPGTLLTTTTTPKTHAADRF
jgi:tetratricopeptide (TPR) repeat protein